MDIDALFQKSELIPAVIQDEATKDILMLGFTNKEAVEMTLETGTAWFWSRSRQKLWNKGETSGHFLHVKQSYWLTATVIRCCISAVRTGRPAIRETCHVFSPHYGRQSLMNDQVMKELYDVVMERKENPQEGSYTCYLFEQGLDKILKKVGEECSPKPSSPQKMKRKSR